MEKEEESTATCLIPTISFRQSLNVNEILVLSNYYTLGWLRVKK